MIFSQEFDFMASLVVVRARASVAICDLISVDSKPQSREDEMNRPKDGTANGSCEVHDPKSWLVIALVHVPRS